MKILRNDTNNASCFAFYRKCKHWFQMRCDGAARSRSRCPRSGPNEASILSIEIVIRWYVVSKQHKCCWLLVGSGCCPWQVIICCFEMICSLCFDLIWFKIRSCFSGNEHSFQWSNNHIDVLLWSDHKVCVCVFAVSLWKGKVIAV
jgi:hypothetical protein